MQQKIYKDYSVFTKTSVHYGNTIENRTDKGIDDSDGWIHIYSIKYSLDTYMTGQSNNSHGAWSRSSAELKSEKWRNVN